MNAWNKWKDRILQTGFQSNIEVRFTFWLCFLIPCPVLFCLYNHSSVQIYPNFSLPVSIYVLPQFSFLGVLVEYIVKCFNFSHLLPDNTWNIFWGNILQKGLFTIEYLPISACFMNKLINQNEYIKESINESIT